MVKFLVYTVKTLRETFRSYEKLTLIFVIPVAFLVALGFLYGDQAAIDQFFTGGELPVLDVGVVNDDNTTVLTEEIKEIFSPHVADLGAMVNITGNPLETGFGNCFVENINVSNHLHGGMISLKLNIISFTDIEPAKIAVQSRQVSACFIITENFTRTLLAGINNRVNLTENIVITDIAELIQSEATIELIGDYTYSRFSDASTALEVMLENFVNAYTGIELPAGRFEIIQEQINSIAFTEFDTYIPGFIIFVLFMTVSGSAGIIAHERSSGAIDRLKLSGFRPISLFLGLTITQLITTACSMFVFIITAYLLGFPGRGNPILAFIISLVAVLPMLGVSLLIASFCKDVTLATGIPGIIAIPLSFLSGAFFPLPEGDIWYLNPFYSASEAMRKVLMLEYKLEQVSMELAFILLIGGTIFLFSAVVFHKVAYKDA
ncbi:MAG: ABC transporter permease [Candidatus Odinarchaeota archaeon]